MTPSGWDRITYGLLAIAIAAVTVAPAASAVSRRGGSEVPPVVIAVVEPGGFNVLHRDFKLTQAQRLRLPEDLPRREVTTLTTGSWDRQLHFVEQGPLGDMEPGILYSIAGTRILGIYTTEGAAVTNIMESNRHGTGTASSAVGLTHGTAPDSWLVFVPDVSESAWRWVARQRWIDAVSTSYTNGTENGCASVEAIARIAQQGRLVFSAVGNGEQAGSLADPSGVPEAYQVGGVDDQGRPYMPLVSGGTLGTPNRPYETGDSFDTEAASSNSLDGTSSFGGTSAAAPSTAGRAATLIQEARSLLGSSGASRGLLAKASGTLPLPRSGPLADGDLSATELSDLLHAVALPSLPASPARYLYEGFGALNDDAIDHATRILEGKAEMPVRSEDQAMHEQVEAMRERAMERCG